MRYSYLIITVRYEVLPGGPMGGPDLCGGGPGGPPGPPGPPGGGGPPGYGPGAASKANRLHNINTIIIGHQHFCVIS